MRYVSLAAVALAASTLVPSVLLGQIDSTKLTVQGYQLLSEVRYTRTQSYFTYAASLLNVGPAIPAVTATLSIQFSPSTTIVPGMGNLQFPAVGTNSQVNSLNTFTILVDRTVNFSFNSLVWSYNAPVANAGPNQTGSVGTTVHLNGSGSTNPSGIGTLNYSWIFTSVPTGSMATIINSTNATPTFVPDLVGTYVVALTVFNGAGSDTSTVTVTVASGPPPPVANAGANQTVNVGSTVHLDGSKSLDYNGKPLTYTWTLIQKPAGSNAVLSGANTVSPTFVADVATTSTASYIAQLVVNDGVNNSPPSTVTITTTSFQPPVANAGQAQTVIVGATVQLDGTGSTETSGNSLTYQWSLLTIPTGSTAKLSSTTAAKPTFVADLAGVYIAQLIVNDTLQNSTPSTVTITANPPQAPTANAGSAQTVQIGSAAATPVVLSGSGNDPQGQPLTYHWTLTVPAGSNTAALSNASIANPTFVPDVLGQYTATLVVNDGTLNSSPSSVIITVTDTQPVANPGAAQNVTTGVTVTLNGSASTDSDHAPLTYQWSLLTVPTGSTAVLNSTTVVSPTFTADLQGTYVAQLIVNDGFQNSAPQTVTITAVTSPNNVITLSPDPLNLVNVPGNLTVTLGAAAGTNGVPVTLTIEDTTIATGPASVTVLSGQMSAAATITPVNVGSTTIIASATGYKPYFGTINVTQAAITLTLGGSTVGIGNMVNGTVTLNAPAPASGVTVALSANPTGFVTLSTSSVAIAPNTSTGTFTVTGGPAAGATVITASASGYTSSQASINSVTRGSISLPTGVTVAPSQTVPVTVSLDQPVSGNPVTITLTSADTTKFTVTPSVTIPVGLSTATAQVTGVNFGSANLIATATGYVTATQSVSVAASLSFPPQTVTVGAGNTANVTLTLSAPAPASGLVVTLSSDTPTVATVPQNVTILATQTTATVTITGVKGGSAKISATSSTPNVSSASVNVTVTTLLTISNTPLPLAVVGTLYSTSETASGGTPPYTFTATGLPAGLSINSTSGAISGTPTTATSGPVAVTITVTDSASPSNAAVSTSGLTINVVTPLTITSTALPGGQVGTAYVGASETASGGTAPYTYSATGLPAGLSINSTTGAISGTPTTPTVGAAVTITATDSSTPTHQTASTTGLTITITNTALTITSNALPNGVVGTVYAGAQETASGGATPYTYSATGLPAGLSINASTGAISGTPTAATNGAVGVTVTVTDSSTPTPQTAKTTGLTINITAGLTITNTALPNGTVGVVYAGAQETASGGTTPYTYSATGLPAGLSINASTGAISGTPSAATSGAVAVTITVTDSSSPHQTASTTGLTITINPPVLTITSNALPSGTVGTVYAGATRDRQRRHDSLHL